MKKIIPLTVTLILLFAGNIASAEDNTVMGLLNRVGSGAQYDTNVTVDSYPVIVGNIIKTFLSLLGVIFIILTFYAGYLWMTASGDAEKLNKAKELLKNSVIGLIIVVSAYAITYFVLFKLSENLVNDRGFE